MPAPETNQRPVTMLLLGLTLAITLLSIVVSAVYLVQRKEKALAQRYNERSAALLAGAVSQAVETAVFLGQAALNPKIGEEFFGNTKTAISVGVIEWHKENFAYIKKIDNQALLRARRIDPKAVTDVVGLYQNDIINGGAAQEQVFGAFLNSEIPLLIVVAPLSSADGALPLSLVSVIDSTGLLALTRAPAGEQTYLVDRYGTLILHPDHERAAHRETFASQPVLKSILSEGATQVTLGSAAAVRLPFAGLVAVTDIPTNSVFWISRDMRVTLGLALFLAIIVGLTGFYLVLGRTRISDARVSADREKDSSVLKMAG